MKLKNNKGYVMTDISIAIIILLILVPTIMGMVYNIRATKRSTEAKAEAINIATNLIETAKGIDIEDINAETVLENTKTNIYKEKLTINNSEGVINTNNSSYKVSVDVVDFATTHSDEVPQPKQNIVKTITAKVEYRLSGKTQEITLKTVIK